MSMLDLSKEKIANAQSDVNEWIFWVDQKTRKLVIVKIDESVILIFLWQL